MKCPICGAERVRLRIVYKDGKRIEGCISCTNQYLTPTLTPGIIDDTMGFRVKVGHLQDIKRRKFDFRTHKVYRDYGRKHFTFK